MYHVTPNMNNNLSSAAALFDIKKTLTLWWPFGLFYKLLRKKKKILQSF